MQKTHLDIEQSTLDALDQWVAELREAVPGGGGIARADLIRDILRRAVQGRATPTKATTQKGKAKR